MSTPPPILSGNVDYLNGPQRIELLSGVEINQNVAPTTSGNLVVVSGAYYYQQFTLPATYPRAGSIWPDITGVQVCVNVPANADYPVFNAVLLAQGTPTVVTSGNLVVTSGSLGIADLVPDPSFEYDALGSAPPNYTASGAFNGAGGTLVTCAVQNGWAKFGSRSTRITATGLGAGADPGMYAPFIPVTPGLPYSYGVWYNLLSASAGAYVAAYFEFYTAADAFISGFQGNLITALGVAQSVATGEVAPSNAAYARCYALGWNGGGAGGNLDYYADGLEFVQSATLPAYFDGDSPGYFWAGKPGDSLSLPDQWQLLASGTAVGIHATGPQVWADVYFPESIPITDQLQNATFSVGLQTTNNVTGWYYSSPNPYPGGAAYLSDNKTPLSPASSFMFRLLSYSADAGTDWLGDGYRNVVFNQSPSNISTFGSPNQNTYWLSKPNPSKFAIECLYFDISDAFGNAQTIDRILLDPITQGPYFHIYYSSDGNPVTDADDWDNKLWTPVAQTYRITKRDVFALPFPITANYIKLEFTRLQSQYYSPGTFSQPVIYRKYPMWLYNYFVNAQPPLTGDSFIASAINIVYNKLQLAFDYYLDDLQSEPLSPSQYLTSNVQSLPSTTQTSQVSPLTLSQINTQLAPYTLPIGAAITGNSILSNFMRSSVNIYNYPVESLAAPVAANTTIVSVPNRDAIVQQENLPDIYFFLTCRHSYQMSQADFEYDRGYFVGLRQVVLLREDYAVPYDKTFYVETAGDAQNAYLNDFTIIDNTWQVLDVDQF